MAVGNSGRVVIDIDPSVKKRLYKALRSEDKSLKDWFLEHCEEYLKEYGQPTLFQKAVVSGKVEGEG